MTARQKPRQTRKTGPSSTNGWREGLVAKREFPGHGSAEINTVDADGYLWQLFNPLGYGRGGGVADTLKAVKRAVADEARRLGWR